MSTAPDRELDRLGRHGRRLQTIGAVVLLLVVILLVTAVLVSNAAATKQRSELRSQVRDLRGQVNDLNAQLVTTQATNGELVTAVQILTAQLKAAGLAPSVTVNTPTSTTPASSRSVGPNGTTTSSTTAATTTTTRATPTTVQPPPTCTTKPALLGGGCI